MLTYVFLVLLVGSLVLSSPSSDNIGSEIGNGDLSNYLMRPVGYLKYWFTRDLASKLLNIIFAIGEAGLLWFLFRPEVTFSSNFLSFLGFVISVSLAMGIYYLLSTSARFVAFWMPENTWGLAFLLIIMIETLSGGIFPLDVLPQTVKSVLELTPFPYLIYFPIVIFQGKITGLELLRVIVNASIWLSIMLIVTKKLWERGLKIYASEGR